MSFVVIDSNHERCTVKCVCKWAVQRWIMLKTTNKNEWWYGTTYPLSRDNTSLDLQTKGHNRDLKYRTHPFPPDTGSDTFQG